MSVDNCFGESDQCEILSGARSRTPNPERYHERCAERVTITARDTLDDEENRGMVGEMEHVVQWRKHTGVSLLSKSESMYGSIIKIISPTVTESNGVPASTAQPPPPSSRGPELRKVDHYCRRRRPALQESIAARALYDDNI